MEENREQTIKRLQEQIRTLQERVKYLEKPLDEAGISYDKDCNESVKQKIFLLVKKRSFI